MKIGACFVIVPSYAREQNVNTPPAYRTRVQHAGYKRSGERQGILILEQASRLDAFSGYFSFSVIHPFFICNTFCHMFCNAYFI